MTHEARDRGFATYSTPLFNARVQALTLLH